MVVTIVFVLPSVRTVARLEAGAVLSIALAFLVEHLAIIEIMYSLKHRDYECKIDKWAYGP